MMVAYAQIYACYGDFFDKNEDPFVKNYYTALLYKGSFDSKIARKAGKVPLKRSMMVVPAKGSIEIKARLFDVDSQAGILDGTCKFPAQPGGSLKEKIDGTSCTLSVSVVWNQGVPRLILTLLEYRRSGKVLLTISYFYVSNLEIVLV